MAWGWSFWQQLPYFLGATCGGDFQGEFDAGLIGDIGSVLGVVIRNSAGEAVKCSSILCLEKWETSVAEAKAI